MGFSDLFDQAFIFLLPNTFGMLFPCVIFAPLNTQCPAHLLHPEPGAVFCDEGTLHLGCFEKMAKVLDTFFKAIPPDTRYHIELRTETYLINPVFEVFEKHGVGQVLSHWTWLPTLKKQWLKAGGRFFNTGKKVIIRLMTPLGLRYEDAYAQAFPFNKLVEGMMQHEMVEETAKLMLKGLKQKVNMNVIINNRAGGNAPMIAQ
jgi:hypothetical protein